MDNSNNKSLSISAQLEVILFYLAEPTALKDLAKMLKISEEEVAAAAEQLQTQLENRGLSLMNVNNKFVITTAAAASPLIEQLIKDELNRDLGKASLETLAIVLYQGPISRTQIDYIRGVNSGYILRHLLTRGLITKSENREGERATVYEATPDLLAHLGLSNLDQLPNKEEVAAKIESFKQEVTQEKTTPAADEITNQPETV